MRARFLPLLVCLLAAGCASPNVNPPVAHSHVGYVDFFTDANESLSWEVKRQSTGSGQMDTVFAEYQPLAGNILRLATPAGVNSFRVWFMNRFTSGPQTVQVQVENGKVTPVHVTLTPAGTVSAENISYGYRPVGRATRRVAKATPEEHDTLQVGLATGTPQEYLPKERMPYFAR